MIGNLYIDGQDAYALYRVLVTKGGYKELAAFPALKSVESNDWAEEDGKEFDLSDPVLDTRELSVNFSFHGGDFHFGAFVEAISDGAYHDFLFVETGKTYRLRLVLQPSMLQVQTLGKFSLRFADDFPLRDYTYAAPQSNLVAQRGYELDGRDLSAYGVYVMQGSDTEIEKSPEVKKNLLQNIKSQSGAVYDGENVVFQTKEVKLNCLMRANTTEEFWRNHDALLYDLIRPDERTLYVDKTGYEYACLYKKCDVTDFIPTGKIWFHFTLVLVFASFRVEGDVLALATEDNDLIITENGELLAYD